MKKQPKILLNNREIPLQDQTLSRCFRKGVCFSIRSRLRFPSLSISLLLLPLFLAFTTNAALSATTANVIHGTAPYLTEAGKAKIESLLSITVTDGTTTTKYPKEDDETGLTAANPIVLSVSRQTMADVEMSIPANTPPVSATDPIQRIDLSTFIDLIAPNYWTDNDGDTVTSVEGKLSVAITDVDGTAVGRSETLSASKAPYKVVLTSSAGTLTTQYGKPNVGTFDDGSATYYIKPAPYVTFAQPNLAYGDNTGVAPYGYAGYNFLGPTNQWDSTQGFKHQNLDTPSSNFPTTGSNNLYFNLKLEGTSGTVAWTYEQSPKHKDSNGTSDIKLTGVESNTTAIGKITLSGPSDSNKPTQKFVATTFTIKADGIAVYRFTISKWFIAKPGALGGYSKAPTYCQTTLGSNNGYRVPLRIDYTNSAAATGNGIKGNYTRAIGGGLFAEWGYTVNSYYKSSDWEENPYWTPEKNTPTQAQYRVLSYIGYVGYNDPLSTTEGAACVSP